MEASDVFKRLKAEAEELGLTGPELISYIREGRAAEEKREEDKRVAEEERRLRLQIEQEEREERRKKEAAEEKRRLQLEDEERTERKRKEIAEETLRLQIEADERRVAEEERLRRNQIADDEREERRRREEAENRRFQMEQEADLKRIQFEADLKAKERDQALEIERQKHQMLLERRQHGIEFEERPAEVLVKERIPMKLPYLDDKDDLESYLCTFERMAHVQKWQAEDMAPRLGSVLKGKAREVYALMSEEDAQDYQKLKNALLQRFKLTADEYRKRFRTARRQPGESTQEFATKLDLYLQRWQQLAKKQNTYEDLRDLFIMEKFIEGIPYDQARFVLQKSPRTVEEAVEEALVFESAKFTAMSTHEQSKPKSHLQKRSGLEENKKKSEESDAVRSGPRTENKFSQQDRARNTCFKCHEFGHQARFCKKNICSAVELQNKEAKREKEPSGKLCASCTQIPFSPECVVTVEGRQTVGVRDTGASLSIVQASLIPSHCLTGRTVDVVLAETSQRRTLPLAIVNLDTPYFKDKVEVAVMEGPANSVLIGNYRKTASGEIIPVPVYAVRNVCAAVQTKAVAKKGDKPLRIPGIGIGDVTREDLQEEQKKDPSLEKIRKTAKEMTTKKDKASPTKAGYHWDKGLLCRYFVQDGKTFKQVVVPRKFRNDVLRLAHDSPMAGHMGVKKTRARLWNDFVWPGICGDVRRYCASCDVCQRTTPKGNTRKVPLGRMPIINTPFERVAIDLIGPIIPASDRGHRYILTVVDYATRYTEAKPLKNIRAEEVSEQLWEIWSRLGVPKEILTDRGSQFVGKLADEVNKLLNIKGLRTTPYHAQGNGLVERYNGTIKQMMRHLCQEQPKEWDRFLPALLFAIREVPQESLGYSPFELLFGRNVRGPIQILKELWTRDDETEEENTRTTFQYVVDLRNQIEETCRLARINLAKAAKRHARNFDRKAKERKLEIGEKVLVLLPNKTNKLEMSWKGPFVVVDKINQCDYKIDTGSGEKLYHANILKKYIDREPQVETHIVAVVMCEPEMADGADLAENADSIPLIPLERKEGPKDAHISEQCTPCQMEELRKLINKYSDSLSDLPGNTNIQKCKIEVESEEPVFVRQYPVPYARVKVIGDEIDSMIKMGVIEAAASPYSAPVVIVKKKDGTNRFCIDYRKLNQATKFDAEPLPDINQIFAKLNDKQYFSKIDLCKGYWQIAMEEGDKEKTAFSTPQGQFQWRRMPFGLKNAGAIFSRMMRKLLAPIKPEVVSNFIDDILIATSTWEEHMTVLEQVLRRLRECNLTAKPSKCFFGYKNVSFLGHEVGAGLIKPEEDKLGKIRAAERPKTKTEMRAFLGLAGYYRKFIANFAETALPLTDATKKGNPELIVWTDACEKAFQELKSQLCKKPVIAMADVTKPFVLRTDASDRGVGAVLLQEKGDMLHPVAYASKKLNSAEINYSTIEKECLAIVWGVKKFEPYLYGVQFTIETDHRPLSYLQKSKTENGRLMRWAIQLQEYNFIIKIIRGSENVGADYLSRSC